MAIDPNISLQVRAPEPVDLMGSRMKALNLRQLTQQGQVRDLQIEEEKQQQADRANQRTGQAVFSELLAKHSGPDGKVDSYAVEKGLAERGYGSMALSYGKERRAESKLMLEDTKAQLDNAKKKLEIVGSISGGILALPPEQQPEAYARARAQMVQQGLMKPEEIPEQFDPAYVAQGRNQSIEAAKQIDQHQADLSYQLLLDKFKEEKKENAPKSAKEWMVLGGQILGATDGADEEHVAEARRTMEYLGAPKPVMALFDGLTPKQATAAGMTPEQRTTAAGQEEQRKLTERGQDMSAATAKAGQAITMRGQNMTDARARITAKGDPDLVKTVMDSPELWDQLTPTQKGSIAPDLAKAGFPGFGKALSQSAINKMADSRTAIASLNDLRGVLKDNEQYIGPVAGWQAIYPWSEARKAQADIDRVRQRVGKTLEGGVLRKEDEEKYKKILATLSDEPSTAFYKIDKMIEELTRDMDTYVEEQRRAGRKVNTEPSGGASPKAGGGSVKVTTPDGKTFTFASGAAAEAFKKSEGIK